MEIDRRTSLRLFAGRLVGPLLPLPLRTAPAGWIFLSARGVDARTCRVSGFWATGAQAFDLPLPARGHSFAAHPGGRIAVHFARRPGRFAYAINLARGAITGQFATPNDRHFFGHGVFSNDGKLLYASENDFEGERGVIGLYDVNDDYKRVGEFASYGIGPHDIGLLSDEKTLVIANGGILTRPDLPRIKLNLPTMAPSLCYVDRLDGKLLQEIRFGRALHQLSIRHLAVGKDDTVAIAMQYEGPAGDLVPLVALHRWARARPARCRDGDLRPLEGPAHVSRAMKQYCGSVCFDSSGRVIAVSAPRGHLVTFWDVNAGSYLSSARVADGSGVAPAGRPGEFLASSGRGGMLVIDAWSDAVRSLETAFLKAGRWDNHLVAATT